MIEFSETMLQMLGAGIRGNSTSLGMHYFDIRCYSGSRLSQLEKDFIDSLPITAGYVDRTTFHNKFLENGRTLMASFNSNKIAAAGMGDLSEIPTVNMIVSDAGTIGIVMVSFMALSNANHVAAAMIYDVDTEGLLDLTLNSNLLSVADILDLGSLVIRLEADKDIPHSDIITYGLYSLNEGWGPPGESNLVDMQYGPATVGNGIRLYPAGSYFDFTINQDTGIVIAASTYLSYCTLKNLGTEATAQIDWANEVPTVINLPAGSYRMTGSSDTVITEFRPVDWDTGQQAFI